jgi:hypothetical protein
MVFAVAFAKNALLRHEQLQLQSSNSTDQNSKAELAAIWADRLAQHHEDAGRQKVCTHVQLTCPEIPPMGKKKPNPKDPPQKMSDVIIRRESISWDALLDRWLGKKKNQYLKAAGDTVGKADTANAVSGWTSTAAVEAAIEAVVEVADGAATAAEVMPVVGGIIKGTKALFKFVANEVKDRTQGCGELKFEVCPAADYFADKVNLAMRSSPFFPTSPEKVSLETMMFFELMGERMTERDIERYVRYDRENGKAGKPRDETRKELLGKHLKHGLTGESDVSCMDKYAPKGKKKDPTYLECARLERYVAYDHRKFIRWIQRREDRNKWTGKYSVDLIQGYHGCKAWTTMNAFENIWRNECYTMLCGLSQDYNAEDYNREGDGEADAQTDFTTFTRGISRFLPGVDLRCPALPAK